MNQAEPVALRRASLGRLFLHLALWAAAVGLAIALVSRHAEMAAIGYRTAELQAQARRLEEENARLEAQVAYLESPARIYAIATSRLGMRRPELVIAAEGVPAARQGPAPAANLAAQPLPAQPLGSGPEPGFLARIARAFIHVVAGPARAEARSVR